MASITVSPPHIKSPTLVDENSSPLRDAIGNRQGQDDTVKTAVTDTPTSTLRVPAGLRIPLEETWRTISPSPLEHGEKDVLQQTNRTLSPPPLSPHRQGPILTRLPHRGLSPTTANVDSPRTLQSYASTPFLERMACTLDRTQSPVMHADRSASSLFELPRCDPESSSADKFKAAMNSVTVAAGQATSPTLFKGCSVTTQPGAHGDKAHTVMSVPPPLQAQAPFMGPLVRCVSPGVVRRSSVGSSSPLYSAWTPTGASAGSGMPSGLQPAAQVLTRLSTGGTAPRASSAWSRNDEAKPPSVVMGEDPLQRLAKEVQVLEQLKLAVVAQEERVRQLRRDVQMVTPRARTNTLGVSSPQVSQYPTGLGMGLQAPLAFPATAPRLNCNSVCRSIHAAPAGSTASAPPGSNSYARAPRDATPGCNSYAVEPRPPQGGSVVLSHTSIPKTEDGKVTSSTFGQRGPSPPLAARKVSDAPTLCHSSGGWPSPPPIFCRPEAPQVLHQPLRLRKGD